MGYFITDHNISTGPVGSKASSIGGSSIDKSTINLSSVEQSTGEINKSSEMTTLNLGDIFGEGAKAATTEAQKVVKENVNIENTTTSSSEVTSENLTNETTKTDTINQTTGEINKDTSLDSNTNIPGNHTTGSTANTGGSSFSATSGSGGGGGGSWSSPSSSSTKSSSKSGGLTGITTGIAGRGGGVSATGAKVAGKTMQSSRPVITTGNIDATGARMTSLPLTENESNHLWDAFKNTGAHIGKHFTGFIRERINVKVSQLATCSVIGTSILSALGNILEAIIIDGLFGYAIAGALDLLGADDAANDLRKFAAVDHVEKINKKLYEETDLGKYINQKSLIKYDSKIAKGITTFAEVTIVIAAAAAVEVFTGGTATPLIIGTFAGLGFLKGSGEAAESAYQNAIYNGETDLTLGLLDNLKIIGRGGLEAMSWAFNAKAGAGIGQMIDAAKVSSWSEVATIVKNDFISEKNLNMMFSKGNVIMNFIGAGFQASPQIMKVVEKAKSGELTAGDVALLTFEIIGYFGLNTVSDGMRNVTSGFISPKKAKMLADNLLSGKKGASFTKYLTEYNDSSIQRIINNLAGEDIYINIQKLESGDIIKIVNMMNDTQKADFAVRASFDLIKIDGSKLTLDDLSKYGDDMQKQIFNQIVYRVINKNDNLSTDDLRKICDEDLFKKIDMKAYETKVSNLYDEGMEVARVNYNAFFKNFREHAELHTKLVRDYAVELAQKAGFSEEEIEMIKYSAECHDLGMKGGVFKPSVKDLKKIGLSEEQATEFLEKYNKKYLTLDPEGLQKTIKETLGEGATFKINEFNLALTVRKNHPLNSAVIILEEQTVPDGIDPQISALLAMTHSKSTSGISSFDDKEMWYECVDKLEEVMNDCGKGDLIDGDSLRKLIDSEDEFVKLKDAALCIRDGDAMAKLALTKDGNLLMQTGEYVILDVEKTRLSLDETPETKYTITESRLQELRQEIIDKAKKEGKELTENQINQSMSKKVKEEYESLESKNIIDNVYNKDGTRKKGPDGNYVDIDIDLSKRIHAGEMNIDFSSNYAKNGSDRIYDGTAKIKDATVNPISTMEAVEERAGEVVTYTNCKERTYEIELSIPEDSELGKWYQKRMDSFRTEKLDELTKTSQARLTNRLNKFLPEKISINGNDNVERTIEELLNKYPELSDKIIKELSSYSDYVESITDFLSKNNFRIKWV